MVEHLWIFAKMKKWSPERKIWSLYLSVYIPGCLSVLKQCLAASLDDDKPLSIFMRGTNWGNTSPASFTNLNRATDLGELRMFKLWWGFISIGLHQFKVNSGSKILLV